MHEKECRSLQHDSPVDERDVVGQHHLLPHDRDLPGVRQDLVRILGERAQGLLEGLLAGSELGLRLRVGLKKSEP